MFRRVKLLPFLPTQLQVRAEPQSGRSCSLVFPLGARQQEEDGGSDFGYSAATRFPHSPERSLCCIWLLVPMYKTQPLPHSCFGYCEEVAKGPGLRTHKANTPALSSLCLKVGTKNKQITFRCIKKYPTFTIFRVDVSKGLSCKRSTTDTFSLKLTVIFEKLFTVLQHSVGFLCFGPHKIHEYCS